MPNNDMDKEENITNKTFEAASGAMGQSVKDANAPAKSMLP